MGVLMSTPTFIIITIIFCSAVVLSESIKLKTFDHQYGPFNDTVFYRSIFAVEAPATISNDALQITPDSDNPAIVPLQNRSGRVFLRRPFKLYNGKSHNTTRVASFNTSFLMNILHNNVTAGVGEGLAFVIAPNLTLPANSSGQYLGLTNTRTDGNPDNRFIAIEFDTYQQDFDPDANHVGLNINTVRSVKTEPLLSQEITLVPMEATLYNVWIHYDGVNKTIEVFILEAGQYDPTPPMPTTPILRYNLDLRDIVNENSYFGFSASTGNETQLNCVLKWNLTVQYFPEDEVPVLIFVLGAGIPAVVLILAAAAGLFCFLRRRRQRAYMNSNIVGALKSLPGMPREFQYKELKKATNNFDEKRKLGQGGYGVVYRGILPKEDLGLAVKCFSRENLKGEVDFLAELTIINRLRHKHLVRLLGWCYKKGKLLLVYELMPNGSLDKHLFHSENELPLSWMLRYKIISGVASALHYLHNEFDQKVVHRDLKASNIMLDSNFNARLGDFGLARAIDNEKTSYAEAEGVLGTMGYIAPECFLTGKATQHSDVYAFGAVLLEVVSGQWPGARIGGFHVLVDWVWSLYREGNILRAVDGRLGSDYVAEEAERILLLGLACSQPMADERPKTQAIVQILSGSVAVPEVPHHKPPFIWPAMGPLDDYSGAFTTNTTSINTLQFGAFGSDYSPHFGSKGEEYTSIVL